MTLEMYLGSAAMQGQHEHRLHAQIESDGRVTFYIHPQGCMNSGHTLDCQVAGNSVSENPESEFAVFDRRNTLIDEYGDTGVLDVSAHLIRNP